MSLCYGNITALFFSAVLPDTDYQIPGHVISAQLMDGRHGVLREADTKQMKSSDREEMEGLMWCWEHDISISKQKCQLISHQSGSCVLLSGGNGLYSGSPHHGRRQQPTVYGSAVWGPLTSSHSTSPCPQRACELAVLEGLKDSVDADR